MSEARAAVALGSNLGDRRATLDEAVAAIAALPGCRLLARSRWFETEPVGGPPQGRFLNGAILLTTTQSAPELLERLLALETAAGRVRGVPDGPRTLDLDLLFHGDRLVDDPCLQLPHPRLHLRRFVLEPLAQIAGDWVHPRLGEDVRALLRRCADPVPSR